MGKFRLRVLLALAGCACVLAWSGCSSNSELAITLTPAASTTVTIKQGATQAISAVVANDPTGEGVTWSLSGGGTLSNPTKTSVTYEAPATLANNITATITATAAAKTSVTATVSITVDSVLGITTTSLPVGAVGVPYTGVVNASGSIGPFTWEQTSGTLPPGLSLSPSTTDSIVIAGRPTVVGTSKFTLQVTDAAGTVASQALSITINPAPPLAVATRSLSAGMVGVSYNQTLQAANGTSPFTWSITAGNLPSPLTLDASSGLISGTPTGAGTSSFTVQVTDSSVPTQTASAGLSITINPSSVNNALLSGNYAFLTSGFSPNGHFVAAGSFVADGAGNITNGVIDTNDPAGTQLAQGFTGTYAIGLDNQGTMALGGRSFAVAVTANGNAKIIEFDDSTGTGTRNSGVLLKQSTSAFAQSLINGNYALGFSGSDAAAARYAFAGSMAADGAGHFNSGLLDANDAGVTQNVAFTGTYTGIDASTGRGTATISISGQGTTNYSFYVVSSTQLLMMETDFVSGQVKPIVSGQVLQQSGLGGSSLSGTGVLQTSAIDNSGGGAVTQSQVGLFSGSGGVNFTVNTNENTGGNLSLPSCTGTYSIDPSTGRTTLSYSGTACAENVLYLVSSNQGFVMGTDANVTFGFLENQSGPFTLSGTYAGGSAAAVLPPAPTQVDNAVVDGTGGTLTLDTASSTINGLTQNQNTPGTFSLNQTDGSGTITAGGQTEVFYMVSATEFISLFTSGPNAADAMLESFQH